MTFDFSSERNDWLPLVAPSCWLRFWFRAAPKILVVVLAWVPEEAKIRNADIA
jgi:hypothetical protein